MPLIAANDTDPPILTVPAVDLSVECGGIIQDSLTLWYQDFAGLEAEDAQGEVTLQATMALDSVLTVFEESILGICIETGSVTVGYFATDDCDNNSIDTSFATFSVMDSQVPIVIQEPTDITLNCDEFLSDNLLVWVESQGEAIAEDECSDVSWNEYLWSDNQGNNGFGVIGDPLSIIVERETCNWFANVSFFASDACGNRTATIGRVTVMDTLPPFFEVIPQDITVNCDNIPAIDAYPVFDYCEANLEYIPEEFSTQVDDRNSCDNYNYLLERVYNVSDACGNNLTHTVLITVIDTMPPALIYDPVVDVSCTSALEIVNGLVTINEQCDSPIAINFDDVDVSEDNCSRQFDRTYTISDVCGNDTTFTQRINLIDNLPPTISADAQDLIIPCDTIVGFDQILADWIADLGGSTASDSCSQLSSFVAESGSFDLQDPTTYPGNPPNIPQDFCQVSEDGIVFTEQYAVVYFDACGNASQTAASVIIFDQEAPLFLECQDIFEVPLMGNDCTANASVPIPIVTDNCQSVDGIFTSTVSAPISSDDTGSSTTLVNTITFTISDLNINQLGKEDGELKLTFNDFDGDGAQEYFDIFIEGTSYGRSPRLDQECQDTMVVIPDLPADSLMVWLSDGVIEVTLIPNVPPGNGSLGINDICDQSMAIATLTTQVASDNLIEVSYSLDGGDVILTDERDLLDLELEEGSHTVEFFFRDCGGNVGTCLSEIIVIDNEPPDLTCPSDTTLITTQTSCCVDYQLSTDFVYVDNCIASGRISETLPEGSGDLAFLFDEFRGDFFASNRQYTYVIPNAAAKILENPQMRIDLTANTESELVNIVDENGNVFVQLVNSAEASCSQQESFLIDIDQQNFDQWVQDDTIRFTFLGGDLPPCGQVSAGFDGISSLRLTLLYSDIQPDYVIGGDTLITGRIEDLENAPVHELCVGNYHISYSVQDATGNLGECSYDLTVADMIEPQAVCRDTTIVLLIDGALPFVFQESDLLESASDNCSDIGVDFDLGAVDCSHVNSTVEITTVVMDDSGNESTCVSLVQVLQQQIEPSFSIGVCQDEDLQLFANVPEGNNINALQFFWSGPNNYISNQENPIIINPQPSDAGTYTLTVRGLNGCVVDVSIDVQIDQFMDPTITAQSTNQCVGEEIVLTTDTYSGDVIYTWFEGAAPNGIQVGQTNEPTIILSGLEGLRLYYVEVSNDVCTSNPSSSIGIEVAALPSAEVLNPFITVCEGDPIQLNAIDANLPGVTYTWSGPNGYSGDGISPLTIPSGTASNEGTYNLVVDNNGCLSDIVSVQVVVFDNPETPSIVGDNLLCEGTPFSLTVSNITNANSYSWYLDGLLFSNTTANTLTINTSTTDLTGEWTCRVDNDLCTSDFSLPFLINVETSLQIGVSNNGPVCVGDSVMLISTLVSQATYTWESPSGVLINGQSPIVLAEAGEYSLTVVNNGGCEATESTTVTVNTPPLITALSNSAPLCESENVTVGFAPTVFPPGDYQYLWSGPNGFTSDIPNPQIQNASSLQNGEYILIVSDGECASEPVSTFVDISDTPSKPEILQVNNTCQGEILQIIATQVTDDNPTYVWDTPTGTIETNTHILLLANQGTENSGVYTVTISTEDCSSLLSDEVLVEVFDRPSNPQFSTPDVVCEGDNVSLDIIQPEDGQTYMWTGPNGDTFEGVTWEIVNVDVSDIGTYTVSVSENGCDAEEVGSGTFFVRSRPESPSVTFVDTILCRASLSSFEYCFDLEDFFDYDSIQVIDQLADSIVLTSSTPCEIIDLSYLGNGEGFYSLQGFNQDCTSDLSQTFIVDVQEDGVTTATFLDESLTICDDMSEGILIANTEELDSIAVTSSTSTIDLELIDGNSVTVSNVNISPFQLYVSSFLDQCGLISIDTITINKEDPVFISDQIIQIPETGITEVDLFENSTIDQDFEFTIVENFENVESTIDGTLLSIKTDVTYIGNDNIRYMICSEMCPSLCDTANIFIQVGNPDDCLVSNVVTPNNDGFNDTFRIPCLTDIQYRSNSLLIFNRWGDEVFEAAPYLNDWDATYQGSALPSGTYFYILELNNDREPIQGFIVVER